MLDHLIFNKLKWFNIADSSDTVNANGKRYFAVPKEFTVPTETQINLDGYGYTLVFTSDTVFQCIGATSDNYIGVTDQEIGLKSFKNEEYVSSHTFDVNIDFERDDVRAANGTPLIISKSLVKNVIWGGKTYLKAILSRLTTAFRRVVIAC